MDPSRRPDNTHNRSSSFFSFRKDGPARSPSFLSKPRMESTQQPPPQPDLPPSRPSLDRPQVAPPPLHPEIRSVVQLTAAHAHKIYFSGPLVRRIERQPDGQKPTKDEGWTEVWAQLGGTTLSIWDMKQIQEASQQGKEVPPTYVNMTDAFVHVLGSVTVPETPTAPSKRYPDVLTLNTAGSNLLLFSCPSTQALLSWAAALRLSAWEKSRLEEIYTAHLLRITLSGRDHPSTLQNGRMEGWVRIRIAGQTDWKKVWMVVTAAADASATDASTGASRGGPSKRRMSNLFGSKDHSSPDGPLPSKPLIVMFAGPKPKDRKKALLTFHNITQAFAVYPERPELISRSTLIKLEGLIGDEDTAGDMRRREGWLLVMPELEGGLGQAEEMLKWVVALHDAFQLYGRPQGWTWDPRDPAGMMFGYPVGPHRDLLFLDREQAETLDVRDDRTSSIRARLLNILLERLPQKDPTRSPGSPGLGGPQQRADGPPLLPPMNNFGNPNTPQNSSPLASQPLSSPQLPPLTFGEAPTPERQPLTPITERSNSISTAGGRQTSIDAQTVLAPQRNPTLSRGAPPPQDPPRAASPPKAVSPVLASVLGNGGRFTHSPSSSLGRVPSPPVKDNVSRLSEDSAGGAPGSAARQSTLSSGSNTLSNGSSSVRMVTSPPPSATQQQGQQQYLASPQLMVTDPVNRAMNNYSPSSVLTSPHSIADAPTPPTRSVSTVSRASVLTSPFSNHGHSPTNVNGMEEQQTNTNFSNEAGALYYMQQFDTSPLVPLRGKPPGRGQHPTTISEGEDESEDDSASPVDTIPNPHGQSPVARQATPTGSYQPASSPILSSPSPVQSSLSSHPSTSSNAVHMAALGRKPSGARAPTGRGYRGLGGAQPPSALSSSGRSEPLTEEDSQSEHSMHHDDPTPNAAPAPVEPAAASSNDDLDALAALSYLDVNDEAQTQERQQEEERERYGAGQSQAVAPLRPHHAGVVSGGERAGTPPAEFKSSFAPSKQAAERRAKAEAQQAAQTAAAHRPGRANGRKKTARGSGWGVE
ncbi:hypothetical protein C8J57DRAFT_709501 [Mycena rebaudengoi]|nr:hypothetical protein C8J57DRAFT_709501 [Mycena rebaudengoi]